jgi:hypothetical protein
MGVCELLIEISKTKIVIAVPAHYPGSSLGTPVPSILSIGKADSASASFETEDTKAELASRKSQISKLKELLQTCLPAIKARHRWDDPHLGWMATLIALPLIC